MHVPARTTFKAGMCTYLGLFWYVHVPRYVQSVLVCSVCFNFFACFLQHLFIAQ